MSVPPSQSGNGQQAADFTLLTDIPVLSGATLDNDRSLILGDRDRWSGRVVLKLWKPVGETVLFYQQQMPAYGWEPLMAATSGVTILSYVRGDRAATVQIEGGAMWGTMVTVMVSPRQSGGGGANGYDTPRASSPERIRSEPLPSSSRR